MIQGRSRIRAVKVSTRPRVNGAQESATSQNGSTGGTVELNRRSGLTPLTSAATTTPRASSTSVNAAWASRTAPGVS